MLNSTTLRAALKEIFGIADKYLVPMDEGWYVPTYDSTDHISTWVGYRILSKRPNERTFRQDKVFARPMQISFRISFVGPQAEELCDQTILWDDRDDVQQTFEKSQTQLNYKKRQIFSYPIKNGGLNDNLCWCVDFDAQSFYTVQANWDVWHPQTVFLGGKIVSGDINIVGGQNG